MTQTEREDQVKRPLRWLVDPTFWRDVASQTVGTLAAAFVLAVFAIAGGWLRTPSAGTVLKAIGSTILVLVVCALLVYGGSHITVLLAVPNKAERPRALRRVLLVSGLFSLVLGGAAFVLGLLSGRASAPPPGCTDDKIGTSVCGTYDGQIHPVWP